jgi:HK97 gp10 family phage protein
MSLDWNSLVSRVIQETAVGLTTGAGLVAARAKELAPIRKVFAGGKSHWHFMSMTEYESAKSVREALGLKTMNIAPRHAMVTYQTSNARERKWMRRDYARVIDRGDSANMNVPLSRIVSNPDKSRGDKGRLMRRSAEVSTFDAAGNQTGGLTRQGRHELNSLRSLHGGMLGGRLRDEIHPTPASPGHRMAATVESPTAYAKYQEFGTRHNPSHPFLRPAADESREEVVSTVRGLVGSALKGGVGGSNLRLNIRLKP